MLSASIRKSCSILLLLSLCLHAVFSKSSCGSGKYSNWAAGKIAGENIHLFDNCCSDHDSCYDNQSGKKHCDEKFRVCLKNMCFKASKSIYCFDQADIFYWAVDKLGRSAYEDAGKKDL